MESTDYIKVPDDYQWYSVSHFAVPNQYKRYIGKVLFPHGLVINRIEGLAQQLHKEYNGKTVIFLCVLKGAFRFCQDLITCVNDLNKKCDPEKCVQVYVEFIRAKSYLNDCQQEINITSDKLDIHNKTVLIVEDVIDTGRTMQNLLNKVRTDYTPQDLKVVSLMLKRNPKATGYRPEYLGFEIPDIWITGYGGFDFNEAFRDLDHIVMLNDEGRKRFSI